MTPRVTYSPIDGRYYVGDKLILRNDEWHPDDTPYYSASLSFKEAREEGNRVRIARARKLLRRNR